MTGGRTGNGLPRSGSLGAFRAQQTHDMFRARNGDARPEIRPLNGFPAGTGGARYREVRTRPVAGPYLFAPESFLRSGFKTGLPVSRAKHVARPLRATHPATAPAPRRGATRGACPWPAAAV
mgnify:CR=1 FL=1